METMSIVEHVKERRILQWALAYIGAAWLALQLADLAARAWDWPPAAEQGLQVLAWFGLPVTIVLAWFHGETGRQRVKSTELVVVALLLVAAGVAVRILSG